MALFLLLIVSAQAAWGQGTPAGGSCDCCAKKPRIDDKTYATFTGPIAVVTQRDDSGNGGNTAGFKDRVVMIWDLKYQAGAPLDTWWTTTPPPPATPYSHPDWNYLKLGDVFGLTLDGAGNIYVAATAIYGSHKLGSLSTATGNAAAGQIYRLQNGTGVPIPFGPALPQGAAGEGIGNIYYDCAHNSLYASDFNDGLIYRLDSAGNQKPNPWDHGLNLPSAVGLNGAPLGRSAILGFDSSSSYAKLGRRPVAVHVYRDRLYYSIWSQDWYRINSGSIVFAGSNGTTPTEIWSVALDANGDPYAPARLEVTLPQYSSTLPYTNPVMDITFGPMGTMLVAERTMTGNNSSYAHSSRVLEYSWNGTQWVLPNPVAYQIGSIAWGPTPVNAAGGVDFDFGPGGRVWATGDALHFIPSDYIYGIQGLPAGGGTHVNSIVIDSNNYVGYWNKTQIGDVRIPCPDCTNPVVAPLITGPQMACVSPSHYAVTNPQPGVTYSWTVSGGTPASGTGPSIDVNWTGTTAGTVTVTATGAANCSPMTTVLNVAPCNTNCEYCNQFKTSVDMKAPVTTGGGLQTVTPVVTSNMPGVRSVTVTLLNSAVTYSATTCGVSGPLHAYIPSASPSSLPPLNPPLLPVPNGNQVIWHSSSSVSLTGGASFPFQLQLPPPPLFTNPKCSATYSFCLRISLTDGECRSCDVIRCFGPFPYVQPPPVTEASPPPESSPH